MKKIDILLIFTLILILTVFAFNNLNDPHIWYDEAVQFFIAKGIFHYSPAFTEPSFDIRDIIALNTRFSADPGGFSLLLTLFTLVSNTIEWLRTLPYLFFITALTIFIAIAKELSGSTRLALALGIAFFILPAADIINEFAFEIRPYIMEVCGIFACFYLLLKVYKNPNNFRFLMLGLVSAFFICARYSFWVYVFVLTLCLFVYVFKNSLKNFIKTGYLYYVPVLTVILFHLLFSLSAQIMFISAFTYYDHYVIGLQPALERLNFFIVNFLSLSALPITLFIAVYYFFRKKLNELYWPKLLFFTVVSYELFFIIISINKLHPWHIDARFSIGLSALSILCFAALISLLYQNFKEYKFLRKSIFCIPLVIILCVTGFMGIKDKKKRSRGDLYSSILNFEKSDANFFEYNYFLPQKVYPVIKFQFEYGKLKDEKYKKIYPDKFFSYDHTSTLVDIIINARKSDVILLSYIYTPEQQDKLIKKLKLLSPGKYKYFDRNIVIKKK